MRLKLKQPSAPFVANVLGYAFLAPKHIWENLPANLATPADWPNDKPVGSGPWKLVEWRKGEYLQFAANRDFFMQPKLDGFMAARPADGEHGRHARARRFRHAGLEPRHDAGRADQPEPRSRGGAHADSRAARGAHEPPMPPSNNKAFRHALQHATDRKKLLDIIFSGAGVVSKGAPITPALEAWAIPTS